MGDEQGNEFDYQEFKKNNTDVGRGVRIHAVILATCWAFWAVASERTILILFSLLTAWWGFSVLLWIGGSLVIWRIDRAEAELGQGRDEAGHTEDEPKP